MKKWIVLKVVKGIAFITLAGGVLGFVVMTLWNALIPQLFNLPVVTFWQALGLLVLTNLMFRGFGRHHGHGGHHGYWKRRFEEKIAAMTPEERDKFKAEWKNRCGWKTDSESPKTV